MKVFLTLPYPPSVNAMYRAYRGRVVTSDKYKAWKQETHYKCAFGLRLSEARGYGDSDIEIEAKVFLPDNRKRDIDNILKPTLDMLESVGYIKDDSQVRKITIERCAVDRENPRIELTLNGEVEGE